MRALEACAGILSLPNVKITSPPAAMIQVDRGSTVKGFNIAET